MQRAVRFFDALGDRCLNHGFWRLHVPLRFDDFAIVVIGLEHASLSHHHPTGFADWSSVTK